MNTEIDHFIITNKYRKLFASNKLDIYYKKISEKFSSGILTKIKVPKVFNIFIECYERDFQSNYTI